MKWESVLTLNNQSLLSFVMVQLYNHVLKRFLCHFDSDTYKSENLQAFLTLAKHLEINTPDHHCLAEEANYKS